MSQFWPSALLIFSSISLIACGSKGGSKAAANPGDDAQSNVTYEGFIKGWLNKKCVKCHQDGKDEPDLSSYDLAKKHARKILQSIEDEETPMPPSGLPPKAEVLKVRSWVNAKTPRGSRGDDDSEDASGGASLVSYDNFVKDWITEECLSCHAKDGESPDLSSFDLVKENIAEIIKSIKNKKDPMPPAGLPKKAIVDKIEAWEAAGMPKGAGESNEDPTTGENGDATDTSTSTANKTGTGTSPSTSTRTSTSTATRTSTGTGTGTALAVTYESFARAYLTQKCTSCHGQGGTPPNLATYATAKAAANASLATINGSGGRIMPPSATTRETADIIAKFQAWIQGGALER